MSHSFIQNRFWITLQVSHHQGWKTCVKKWKVILIFRGADRLPATEIAECLEIIEVGWNLKQFDGFTWLTTIPHILRQMYVTMSTTSRNNGQWLYGDVGAYSIFYIAWLVMNHFCSKMLSHIAIYKQRMQLAYGKLCVPTVDPLNAPY